MGSLFFYQNPRLLLILIVGLCASGVSSFLMLPRMEDPILRKRVGVISTVFPGATAEELEMLVAVPIEKALMPVESIESFRTNSRAGSCNIVIQLADAVTDVEDAWEQVHQAIRPLEFPEDCQPPQVRVFPLKAYASILSIQSGTEDFAAQSGTEDFAACRAAARELQSSIELIPGTEKVLLFGASELEMQVIVDTDQLPQNGLSFGRFAAQVSAFYTGEAIGESSNATRKRQLGIKPISWEELQQRKIRNGFGNEIAVGDLASFERNQDPNPLEYARVDGASAIVLGVRVKDRIEIKNWSKLLEQKLADLQRQYPQLIAREVFSQSQHIDDRMQRLIRSLALSTVVVVIVVLLMMGWRSMIVVFVILPLSILSVMATMNLMNIPIHQISVTGIIVSLGLLIDNAIIVVDDIKKRIVSGQQVALAIRESILHLRFPLLGATVTTALSFLPIALLPGAAGEFVGSMAITVIAAVVASYLVAIVILPCLAGLFIRSTPSNSFAGHGLIYRPLSKSYFRFLKSCFATPWLALTIGILVPATGFLVWKNLPVQFFPAADRQQIQIEIELDKSASLDLLRQEVQVAESILGKNPLVANQNWFLGSSAPMFYYNVVPRYERAPHYAQAFLNLKDVPEADRQKELVNRLQGELAESLPAARVTVRRLEQGPPFDAPVEIIVAGPDVSQLISIGQQLRKQLSDIRDVIQTRSDLQSSTFVSRFVPNLRACEELGILPEEIHRELGGALNGIPIGRTLVDGESVEVRVRLEKDTFDIEKSLLELPLNFSSRLPPNGLPNRPPNQEKQQFTPLVKMLGEFEFQTQRSTILKRNGEYINLIKGYIRTSAFPASVLEQFKRKLEDVEFKLPTGYRIEFAGEEEKRTAAESSLFTTAPLFIGLIIFLMVAIFGSFRSAFCIAIVGVLTLGLVPLALAAFSMPFGFMALVGAMGLIGIAINDSIVVLAGLNQLSSQNRVHPEEVARVVFDNTRHILTTTLTTVAGFLPLVIYGGEFWPPMAIAICVGILGATLLALFVLPSLFMVLHRVSVEEDDEPFAGSPENVWS